MLLNGVLFNSEIWYNLKGNEIQKLSDMRRFYKALKLKESDGDWKKMVRKDLNELNIKKDEKEISKMSKYKFKNLLKKLITEKAFSDLLKAKETHSKMESVVYSKVEVQPYLRSNSGLTSDEKQLLINLRTRMTTMRKNCMKTTVVSYVKKKKMTKDISSVVVFSKKTVKNLPIICRSNMKIFFQQ